MFNSKYFKQISLILLLFVLSSCSSIERTTTKEGSSLYDRVKRTGKIRCSYFLYNPICVKDPATGKLSGIGVEALELVAKKLGLTVEYVEEVGLGTLIEGLKTRRYDLCATPICANASRAKVSDFSKPLYYQPYFAYARRGDERFKGHFERINAKDVTIACIDGGTAQVIAEDDFPQAQLFSVPEMTEFSQILLNVSSSKADVTFAEPSLVERYLRTNPGTVVNVDASKPLRMFSCCWAIDRGEFEFKAMLDTVLEEVINSGAMEKILAKYKIAPDVYYRVASPYQSPYTNDMPSCKTR